MAARENRDLAPAFSDLISFWEEHEQYPWLIGNDEDEADEDENEPPTLQTVFKQLERVPRTLIMEFADTIDEAATEAPNGELTKAAFSDVLKSFVGDAVQTTLDTHLKNLVEQMALDDFARREGPLLYGLIGYGTALSRIIADKIVIALTGAPLDALADMLFELLDVDNKGTLQMNKEVKGFLQLLVRKDECSSRECVEAVLRMVAPKCAAGEEPRVTIKDLSAFADKAAHVVATFARALVDALASFTESLICEVLTAATIPLSDGKDGVTLRTIKNMIIEPITPLVITGLYLFQIDPRECAHQSLCFALSNEEYGLSMVDEKLATMVPMFRLCHEEPEHEAGAILDESKGGVISVDTFVTASNEWLLELASMWVRIIIQEGKQRDNKEMQFGLAVHGLKKSLQIVREAIEPAVNKLVQLLVPFVDVDHDDYVTAQDVRVLLLPAMVAWLESGAFQGPDMELIKKSGVADLFTPYLADPDFLSTVKENNRHFGAIGDSAYFGALCLNFLHPQMLYNALDRDNSTNISTEELNVFIKEVLDVVVTAAKGAVTAAEKVFVPSRWLEQAKEDANDFYKEVMEAWKKVDTDREKSISADDVMKAFDEGGLPDPLMDLVRFWKEGEGTNAEEWEQEHADEDAPPTSMTRRMFGKLVSVRDRMKSKLVEKVRAAPIYKTPFGLLVKPLISEAVRQIFDSQFWTFAKGFSPHDAFAQFMFATLLNRVKETLADELPKKALDTISEALFDLLDTDSSGSVRAEQVERLFTLARSPGGATAKERVKALVGLLAREAETDPRVTLADLTAFGDKFVKVLATVARELLDVVLASGSATVEGMVHRVCQRVLGDTESITPTKVYNSIVQDLMDVRPWEDGREKNDLAGPGPLLYEIASAALFPYRREAAHTVLGLTLNSDGLAAFDEALSQKVPMFELLDSADPASRIDEDAFDESLKDWAHEGRDLLVKWMMQRLVREDKDGPANLFMSMYGKSELVTILQECSDPAIGHLTANLLSGFADLDTAKEEFSVSRLDLRVVFGALLLVSKIEPALNEDRVIETGACLPLRRCILCISQLRC